jgi:hypothetical protein
VAGGQYSAGDVGELSYCARHIASRG